MVGYLQKWESTMVETLFDKELQGLLQIIFLLKVFLKKRPDLKKLFMSDEWAQYKLNRTNIGWDMEKLMFDHQYWDKVMWVVLYFEPLFMVLRIMDSEVVPTMSFLYELMQVMIENLIRQQIGN